MTGLRSVRPGALAAGSLVALLVALAGPSLSQAQVASGSLRAQVAPDPWRLTMTDAGGATVLREHPGLGSGPSGTLGFRTAAGWFHATRVASGGQAGGAFEGDLETTDPSRGIHVRLAPDGEGIVRLTASLTGSPAGVTAIGIGFDAPASERYLGFGERSNAVDQRGNEVENYVSDGPYKADDRPIVQIFVPPVGLRNRDDSTYFPMPWLLSTAGYGVLMHNTETSYFRLGSSDVGAWSLEAEATSLDLSFVGGPKPADVVRRLTTITGRQPPASSPWVFGPWYQATGSDRFGQAQALRSADVPVSALQTYLHYLPCGDQQGVEAQQPQSTSAYHGLGLAITTYFNPMICTSYSPAYGQAAAAGVLTEDASNQPYVYPYTGSTIFDVSQFDFSAPGATAFYGNLLAEAVGHGYDGWMEDFGEYTPLDSQSANGMGGDRMHNLYPKLYHCASRAYTGSLPTPPVAFVRSGWTGVHPCAQVVWGGDPTTDWGFDGLSSAVKQALSLGTSGIGRWGSDIGGYFSILNDSLSPELLARWIELGSVSGVMRTEANGYNLGTPSARPQIFDPATLPVWRRYAKLRTQLYPYIQAADADYERTGMPIMRHLALTNPGDSVASGREDEFMFGPDLLAAPVLAPGASERRLYLPAGRWVDFWRAVRYRSGPGSLSLRRAATTPGKRAATIAAPLAELPLMVRAGAVLPLLPSTVDTLASYGSGSTVRLDEIGKRLHLLAFPRGRSSSPFGERGLINSREKRGRWRLAISRADGYRVELEASLGTMRKRLRPCRVLVNGRPLKPKRWSVRRGVLRARFRARGSVSRLTALDRRRCEPAHPVSG